MMEPCNFFAILSVISLLWASESRAEQSASFALPSSVRIEIHETSFDRTAFTIVGCNGGDGGCLINGKAPFGTDGEIPKTYVKSINVLYKDRRYSLDVSNMYDAWGKRPLEVKGAVRYFGGKCHDVKNCEFRGIFSDGSGSYVAEWKIIAGLSFRTILTNSDDVVKLFIHNIDPPEIE
jgi:hypothetical protein